MASSNRFVNAILEGLPLTTIAGVLGYTGWTWTEQSFLAESQSKKRSYYGDLDTKLDDNTQQAIDKVTDKFLGEISAKQLALTQFYWSNQPLINHIGSTKTRFGTYIGIPVHYMYKTQSEVDLTALQVDTDVNKVDPVVLQNLRDSLVLSQNAKMFAIASELHAANSLEIAMKGEPLIMVLGAIATGKYVFLKRLPKMSSGLKILAFANIALLWVVIHSMVAGLYTIALQGVSDRKAADFGDDFLKGGLEYLYKLEQKNKSLRELDSKNGKYSFEENGNEIQTVFKIRKMPLSERKRCLLEYADRLKEKTVEQPETNK